MQLDNLQVRNGTQILLRVAQRARQGKWSPKDARRVARLSICCAMTESALRMYANRHNPESMKHYHEAVGTDHASVGLYQQQVPMWGSVAECMDPALSTDKFVNRVLANNDSRFGGITPWVAIQKVQVSAFSDGSNYRAHFGAAEEFVRERWEHACAIAGFDYKGVI